MKAWKKFIAVCMTAALSISAVGCGGGGADKSAASSGAGEEIIIGQSAWIGYAPFYIAQEKGYFKDHGVNVKIQNIESRDSKNALAADKIQGMCTTVDMHVINASSGMDIEQVLALDTSSGGDGVIAKKEYPTIESLKGKKIAMDTSGGADFFWFQYLLHEKGMTLKDFDVQNMTSGDAGAAFVSGKVDAAVTWEPWLTKASKTDFGHTIIDSTKTPGIIVDSFVMKKDYIAAHPDAVKGITAAWYDALKFLKEHPDEAAEIMAKGTGEDTAVIKDELKGCTFYDQEANKKYFGTKENPGELYKVVKMASDFWTELKIIEKPVDPASIINGSFI